MIWNIIPNSDRLSLWKKMRDNIKAFSLEEQLIEIARFFQEMPFGSRTLDYYSPLQWPTPWEILFYGEFCLSSISLLIFYTLLLSPGEKTIELVLVEDNVGVYLLPIINNHFVLNYELGKVSKWSLIQGNFKIIKRYSQDQIRTIS